MKHNKEHLLCAHGIQALRSTYPGVQALKRKGYMPSLHGNKVWSSCFVLMDYLKKYPLTTDIHIIDVGCGWGTLSCFLAKQFDAKVCGVDADPYIEPFFELTALVNEVQVSFDKKRFEQLTGRYLSAFDVLVGSDICFWDSMTDILYALIRRALRHGVKHLYIADPGRPPFWALADRCADTFYGEVITHRTQIPRSSEKHILVIHA